jgi:uncharacterized membrane protein (Fun14 family)
MACSIAHSHGKHGWTTCAECNWVKPPDDGARDAEKAAKQTVGPKLAATGHVYQEDLQFMRRQDSVPGSPLAPSNSRLAGNTLYNGFEVQRWADAASSAADAWAVAQAIKGAVGGGVIGLGAGYLMESDVRGVGAIVGVVVGVALGWWGAQGQVSIMKLLAQMILCQARIEENTRPKV